MLVAGREKESPIIPPAPATPGPAALFIYFNFADIFIGHLLTLLKQISPKWTKHARSLFIEL